MGAKYLLSKQFYLLNQLVIHLKNSFLTNYFQFDLLNYFPNLFYIQLAMMIYHHFLRIHESFILKYLFTYMNTTRSHMRKYFLIFKINRFKFISLNQIQTFKALALLILTTKTYFIINFI
jgi:hypothetical protein